jgi:hypothetical protein
VTRMGRRQDEATRFGLMAIATASEMANVLANAMANVMANVRADVMVGVVADRMLCVGWNVK